MVKALKNLKPIKGNVAAALILVVLSQLTSLALPLMMSLIINNGISAGDMTYIKNVGMMMGGIAAVNVVIAILSSYYSSKTAMGYGRILREKIFLKVETLSQGDIDKIGTPSLITRCTNDVKVLQDFILQGLMIIISAPIMLVGGTFMAFFLNAKLALIILVIIPAICIIALAVVKNVMPLFKKRQKLTDEVNRFLREKLSGIRVIRAFNTTEYEDEKFSQKNIQLSRLVLKFSRIMAILLPICMVLIVIALDLLIFIATKNIDSMTDSVKIQNTVGDLQAFIIYIIMIIAAVTMSAAMFVIVPRANISAKRINEVIELEPAIRDIENPKSVCESLKGTVEFKNVCFSYHNAEQPILSDISFTAESGKVTAIIGATGSGKTTLINLISRFYDVTDGEVLFDGVDVRELAQNELHSRIGYVPQKAFLFSGTIRDNLKYGNEQASDERLWLALDISQSSEFVDGLENGIDSRISQSGNNLSGGQKQRLSIARALTRDAEVYIFDDSFSALDFRTDAKLRAAIRKNINATVIIVAQRVGTIIDADQIIVLDEGKIVGTGTHEQLLENCDVYRDIALSQLTKEATA